MSASITKNVSPVAYPFGLDEKLDFPQAYSAVQRAIGTTQVRLSNGDLAWLVTRYADARMVLGDSRFNRLPPTGRDEQQACEGDGVLTDGIFTKNPPDHTRLRRLLAGAFSVRRAEKLRPRIRELAEDFLDQMIADGPPADLVDRFALPVPAAVICELLGVPMADHEHFRALSDGVLCTSGLGAAAAQTNHQQLREYMARLIALHRSAPADDLISALIAARDVNDRLSEEELVELCVGILVAGYETTATQIPNFLYVLLEHPDRLAQLRADPGLIPNAVEELMRFIPFAGADFPRYPTEDIEVGGVLIRAGEQVLVAVSAANRDALRFDFPNELRFDRTYNHHIGFGHGVHHCLGAPLATVELQEALRALLAKLPLSIHLASDISWKKDVIVRGPYSMPVAW